MGTLFASVYDRFLGKITDDMYMELTPMETIRDLQKLLIDAIPGFEFPRKQLAYVIGFSENKEDNGYLVQTPDGKKIIDTSYFASELDDEEINILAILMMNCWLQRQITTIENIRMKYSGSDFKMTSQANHLGKLLALQAEVQRQSLHMQRLYKRRKTDIATGCIKSNWSVFKQSSSIRGKDSSTPHIIYDGGRIE